MKLFIALVVLSISFSDAKPAGLSSVCSNPAECFVDPCQVSRCDAYPKAQCVSNYCGGCNAYWYFNNQLIEQCSSPIAKPEVRTEASDCDIVTCLIVPCALATCDKYPEAVCRSDYCGGCHAWFYLDDERVACN